MTNEQLFGLIFNFESLEILLNVLMEAGYKNDRNAQLIYLDITESEDFQKYLEEKERRDKETKDNISKGLQNFMPMEGRIKPRNGTNFSIPPGERIVRAYTECNHDVYMTLWNGDTYCVYCGHKLNMFHQSEAAFYPEGVPTGQLTADGAMLEKCFNMEAYKKDEQ